jgi:hypothetical protein
MQSQVVYAGSGKARTLPLVIKQSPLIEIFWSIHVLIQDNFHMLHRSVCHAPPDLTTTIKVLCNGLKKYQAHKSDSARQATVKLIHHFQVGMKRIQTEKNNRVRMELGDEGGDTGMAIEMDDLEA